MLLDRVLGRRAPRAGGGGLAADARAMRCALDGLHAEAGSGPEPDLRRLVRDLLSGEVAAPTADVAALKRRGVDPDDFYTREVRPAWEGIDEEQRANRLDGLVELCAMLASDSSGLADEMGPAARTKMLAIAWAFDWTHGYVGALGRGELP
jgi:hypothetical protein